MAKTDLTEGKTFVPDPPAPVRTVGAKEEYLDCKKGDRLRLLVPHYDGVQRIEADTIVFWWSDEPPLKTSAARAEDKQTPLDAPAFTDGKPSEDYLDPTTGEKPVIDSV